MRFALARVPNMPVAKGLSLYFSGIAIDPGGVVMDTFPWVGTTIR